MKPKVLLLLALLPLTVQAQPRTTPTLHVSQTASAAVDKLCAADIPKRATKRIVLGEGIGCVVVRQQRKNERSCEIYMGREAIADDYDKMVELCKTTSIP